VVIPYIQDGFNLARGKASDGVKVLDLGCGNGRVIKLLESSSKKFDYLGIDFSEELLTQGRKQWPGHTFQLADIRNVDLLADSFDLVLMIASFHHLETKKERILLLAKVYQALRPGGYLLLTNWNLWQRKYLKYLFKNIKQKKAWNDFFIPWKKYSQDKKTWWRYYHGFTKRELDKLLIQAGFAFVSASTTNVGHNLLSFVKK